MERRYWDSFCFISMLNNELPHSSRCERILDLAKQEKLKILVSPLTIVETIRPKGSSSPLPAATQEKITAFFENDYILFRIIDRLIANRAVNLCRIAKLHPRDALHVAVAIEEKCNSLETSDRKMLSLNGIDGLEIRHPYLPEEQQDIDDAQNKTSD